MNNVILPETIYKIIDHEVCFIDIRDHYQYQQQHIKNFINIPDDELHAFLSLLPKDKPICLICYSGKRTQELSEQLNQKGYQAYYVEGGFQAFLNLHNNQYY